jgi:hypothetical protein
VRKYISKLLLMVVPVTLCDDQGRTALHLATLGRHVEVVRLLLLAGSDPRVRTQSGSTALKLITGHSSGSLCNCAHGEVASLLEAEGRVRHSRIAHSTLGH